MDRYSSVVEGQMVRFYRTLNERDRRRDAAVEALKLGHGGIEDVSGLLACDPMAIGRGMTEREADEEPATDRQRKKAAGENR